MTAHGRSATGRSASLSNAMGRLPSCVATRAPMCFAIWSARFGCQPDASTASLPRDAGTGVETPPGGPQYERPGFCARDGADVVRDVFCAEELREIPGLLDLERRLGLGIAPEDA